MVSKYGQLVDQPFPFKILSKYPQLTVKPLDNIDEKYFQCIYVQFFSPEMECFSNKYGTSISIACVCYHIFQIVLSLSYYQQRKWKLKNVQTWISVILSLHCMNENSIHDYIYLCISIESISVFTKHMDPDNIPRKPYSEM